MSKKPLTVKRQLFVQEYLISRNASKAAIKAGYSEKTARAIGHELLTKPDIRAAVDAATQARAERTGITQDDVLRELMRALAMAMGDEPQEIAVVSSGEIYSTQAKKTELSAAAKILDLLGRHTGLFDKPQDEGVSVIYNVNYGDNKNDN